MDFSKYAGLAKRALLELGLELQPEQFKDLIQSLLSGLSVNLVDAMIEKNVPWPVTDDQIVKISDFREFMAHLTPERVFDLLESSRPDLAKVIENHDEKGAVWFVTNVQNLHDRIMAVPRVESAPQTIENYTQLPEQKPVPVSQPSSNDGQIPLMALACGECGEGWLVLETKVEDIKGCPFCLAVLPVKQASEEKEEKEEPGPRLRI